MGKDLKQALLREADRLKRRVADINDDLDDYRGKVEEYTEGEKPKPPKPGEKPKPKPEGKKPKKDGGIFEESDDDDDEEPDDEVEE